MLKVNTQFGQFFSEMNDKSYPRKKVKVGLVFLVITGAIFGVSYGLADLLALFDCQFDFLNNIIDEIANIANLLTNLSQLILMS